PAQLAEAVEIATAYGYEEYNLNIGCPSDRVQSGSFGACLMGEPVTVAACVQSMNAVTDKPVTVKTRIGIDDRDDYGFLTDFISAVTEAGCGKFIVHARKAILSGLSPKENRSIPPLIYERVYQLKQDFPHLQIILNGGIRTTDEVREHLQHVDGVMIGRQAYSDPYWLTDLQQLLAGNDSVPRREDILAMMADYAGNQVESGARMHHITRHMLGLFTGQPGARKWRRFISQGCAKPSSGPEVLLESINR
ncbi:MAG: tRNA dihydrouridine(20/20a) synthase DusA, partial [Gammaproteobacteria bacterium]